MAVEKLRRRASRVCTRQLRAALIPASRGLSRREAPVRFLRSPIFFSVHVFFPTSKLVHRTGYRIKVSLRALIRIKNVHHNNSEVQLLQLQRFRISFEFKTENRASVHRNNYRMHALSCAETRGRGGEESPIYEHLSMFLFFCFFCTPFIDHLVLLFKGQCWTGQLNDVTQFRNWRLCSTLMQLQLSSASKNQNRLRKGLKDFLCARFNDFRVKFRLTL